jgi:hypothetical protein
MLLSTFFQMDENTTFIFGGSNNNHAIVSFDWKTMQYTPHTPGIDCLINLSTNMKRNRNIVYDHVHA